MRVPSGALWGAQTQRAVLNFPISGLRPWRAFIWSMALIKRAAAEVNRELGLLDPQMAQAIAQAASEVMEGNGTTSSSSIHSRPARAPATT